MTDLVLSERISPAKANESITVLLKKLRQRLSGLEVTVDALDLTSSGWPRIRVSGPDEEISEQILRQEIGIAKTKPALLDPNTITKAFIDRIDSRGGILVLDAGLDPEEKVRVEYATSDLRAQLFDGEQIPLEAMVAEHCLHPGIPLEIRIPTPGSHPVKIRATLSDRQVERLRDWKEEPFERLIIQGAFTHEVEAATRQLKLTRDLADTIELSLVVSVLICKLGTKARGLIPRLGPLLKEATFYVHSGSSLSRTDSDLHRRFRIYRTSRKH